jgi:DNA-binding NarL/FixJ family response regulator
MTIALSTEIFSEIEWIELIRDLSLPPRQAQVVRYILSGLSDKQIALEMQISVAGVRAHLNRLFTKFDLSDRHELVLHMFNYFLDGCRTNGCLRYR